MSEFKVGDKVKTLVDGELDRKDLLKGAEGVIEEISDSGSPYLVKFNPYQWNYTADELELIPKYKTLAELWEENDRRPFKAVPTVSNTVHHIVGLDGDCAVFSEDKNFTGYSSCHAEYDIWQLYQEPEEEEKPAEKCEHKSASKLITSSRWHCNDCEVELVETWLFYYRHNDESSWTLNLNPKTEQENSAFEIECDLSSKKATWSRELFEVRK